MSRATVRAALVSYFTPPAVTGLNTVYSSYPKRIPATAFRYGQAAGTKTGTVGVIHIERSSEERIALGGITSGKKEITYTVGLDLYCHSLQAHSEDAMADFDVVVENVLNKIRADRQLAATNVIFRAGETLLECDFGEPKVIRDGATEQWGVVRFEVVEIINA